MPSATTSPPATTEPAEYETVSEVAARFRVSKGTVYRLIYDGAFPGAIRARGNLRIPTSDVAAFIAAGGTP